MRICEKKACLIFITVFVLISNITAQVCPKFLKTKYITLTEKVIQYAKIYSIKGHSIISVKGGFWLTGTATMENNDVDFFYSKLDDTGKVLFFKTVGLSTKEGGFAVKLASTPSGGVIITGQNYDNSVSAYLGAIVSVDNTGNLKWYRKTSSNGNSGVLDAIRGVMVEPNGDVICVGDAQQYSNLNYSRALIIKLDSHGNQKYINQINVSTSGNNQQTHPTDIKSTKYGYLIGGWTTNAQNAFLLLVNKSTGASINCIYLKSSYRFSSDHILLLPSERVFLSGFTNVNGTADGFIATINLKTKKIDWQKSIPIASNSNDYCGNAIRENENLFISTQTNNLNTGIMRQSILTIDTNGNYINGNLIYNGSNSFNTSNACRDFDLLSSGGLVFYGQDNSTSNVHLNLAIGSPCTPNSCAINKDSFIIDDTYVELDTMVCNDYFFSDVTKESPNIEEVLINRNLACSSPTQNFNSTTNYEYFICTGDSILILGKYRTQSGTFSETLKSYEGYDSMIKYKINVMKTYDTLSYHLCRGQSVTIDSMIYNSKTNFTKYYTNFLGCDSVMTYIVNIHNDTSYKRNIQICNSDSILLAKKYRKVNGVFIDSLKTYWGCDSILITTLSILKSSIDSLNYQLCNNQSIIIEGNSYSDESEFEIHLKNSMGCDSIRFYKITKSNVKAKFDIDSAQSPQYQLTNQSFGNSKFFWDFGDTTFDSIHNNPVHTYKNKNNQWVKICLSVNDSFGCFDTICKLVRISELDFWLFNSFSPGNDDGYNDIFKIGHIGNFNYNLMVYNRWGALVFETQNANINDESKFWNGKVMNTGANCPAGSYFVLYQIYLKGHSEPPKEIHGIITLIRE